MSIVYISPQGVRTRKCTILPTTTWTDLHFFPTNHSSYSTRTNMSSGSPNILQGIHLVADYGALKDQRAPHDDDNDDDQTHASFAESVQLLITSALSLPGDNCSLASMHGGTTTVVNQIFNLIKNIVGCGVLALPNGVAAFANAPSGLLPASFWILFMGSVFGYFFLLIGKTCQMTWALTYKDVWEETMGPDNGAYWVALSNMLKPALANLAYSMILADTFKSLFETIGWHLSRSVSLWLVTLTALLPLCLLKNLKVLAPFSILGTIVFFLVAIVMGIRYMDGTYDAETGYFVDDLDDSLKPSFGNVGFRGAFTPNVLVLICMLFEAFVAHYNAPRFYTELKNHTIPRFRTVVVYSFGVSSIIFVVITAFGFMTFGANSNGYILNNYSTRDSLATFCRISIAVAIICTYPIVFMGYRDGIVELLNLPPEKQTSNNLNVITVVLLIIVTLIAMSVTDLGLINAIGGGTLATAIVFVFPTLMYRQAVKRKPFAEEQWDDEEGDEEDEEELPTPSQKREVVFSTTLMCMGVAMGAIGVWMAIANEHHVSSLNAVVGSDSTMDDSR